MNIDKTKNLIEDLYLRELDSSVNSKFKSKNVFSKHFISNLNLESELQGHDGCVNCLEWNASGTLLASGSDDLKIIIWDPFKKKQLNRIDTKHRGNIFSVKFLPFTGDSLIASGAADRDIYVYDVNRNLNINEIHAHQNRVKRLETSSDTPFLFWSCGEDGVVLQHDIRCQPSSITSLLLNYSSSELVDARHSEIKCIAINQTRSEYLAVGLSDPYARVYDRRMIKLRSFRNRNTQTLSTTTTSTSLNSLPKCLYEYSPIDDEQSNKIPLSYFVPGHLPRRIEEYQKRMKTLSVTFVSFSPNGNELLVNLGGEQLYLYDLVNSCTNVNNFKLKYDSYKELLDELDYGTSQTPTTSASSTTESTKKSAENMPSSETDTSKLNQKKKYKLPPKAEELKIKANASFEEQNYVEAIEYYNLAIQIAPDSPILYGNRAATLMKRNWDGDVYSAMRDCYIALNLDKSHLKSHFRLAKCLNDLKWHQEAFECINIFCKRFPDYAKSQACENLMKEIKNSLKNIKAAEEKVKKSSNVNKKGCKSFYDRLSFVKKREHNGEDSSSEAEDENSENEWETLSESSNNNTNNNNKESDELNNNDNSSNNKNESTTDSSEGLSSNSKKTKKQKTNRNNDELNLNKKEIKKLVKDYRDKKLNPVDFKLRYCGHCNVATDIKEANFIGENYLAAGSDDGSFFIWNKSTTNVVRVLKGDESIVNCIQPHPYSCFIATSGIDPHVRLWSPKINEDTLNENDDRVVTDIKSAALNNQLQMNSHPFEYLFLNLTQNTNWEADDTTSQQNVGCRPS